MPNFGVNNKRLAEENQIFSMVACGMGIIYQITT